MYTNRDTDISSQLKINWTKRLRYLEKHEAKNPKTLRKLYEYSHRNTVTIYRINENIDISVKILQIHILLVPLPTYIAVPIGRYLQKSEICTEFWTWANLRSSAAAGGFRSERDGDECWLIWAWGGFCSLPFGTGARVWVWVQIGLGHV